MIPELPTCKLVLRVTNPLGDGLSHAFRMPVTEARERKPITLAGRSGWMYLSPVQVATGYDGDELTVEAEVVFDPPLTLVELLVMAGAEVLS